MKTCRLPNDDSSEIRIYNAIRGTYANGPGKRVCVWFQGCDMRCPGCFNPGSHDRNRAVVKTTTKVFIEEYITPIAEDPEIDGITFSGGEPLEQLAALNELIVWVRTYTNWSIVLFTGYTCKQLERDFPGMMDAPDVVIAGPYIQERRVARGLVGSANKEFVFNTTRYTLADFERVPAAEIRIGASGQITQTGINPVKELL